MKHNNIDTIIIGAGPIGLSAAFHLGILGIKSLIIESLPYIGGQCTALYPEKSIYDIPGHTNILAKELINKLYIQSTKFKTKFILGESAISYKKINKDFIVNTNNNNILTSRTILIAAGFGIFYHKKPNIINIEEFENKSIFYSITNKKIFKNKIITIAGGGNSAIDWTISLTKITKKIYLIHRRNKFKAFKENTDKLKKLITLGLIKIFTPYQISSVKGKNGFINEINIINFENKRKKTINSDYLLLFFGLSTNLGPLLSWNIEKQHNKIMVNSSTMQTSTEGIFAIGDIVNYPGKLKLITTGFGESAIAAHNIYKFIKQKK